jgi:hypothetical protein
MAAFYFDEDVPEDLVPLLTEHGHIVATTRSEGRKGAPDPRQLLYAAGRGWILVTLNRGDYRLLHDAWLMWSHQWSVSLSHAGILITAHVPRVEFSAITAAIHDLVSASDARLTNSLYEWNGRTGWRRWPR